MNADTWVSIAAAAVALSAMLVAIWQAREARGARQVAADQAATAKYALVETQKQTKLAQDAATNAALVLDATEKASNAAEASADEARRANALTQERHAREEAAETRAALARARKVRIDISGSGGYRVHVHNGAEEPFYQLKLENFVRVDRPSWGWRIARSVIGASATYDRIDPGAEESGFYVEMLDEDGVRQPFDLSADTFEVTIGYSDVDGQRWRRTGPGDPEPVGNA